MPNDAPLSWFPVFLRNAPLLATQAAGYMLGRRQPPRPFRIEGREFWIRNPNMMGILQKAIDEARGTRREAYERSDAYIDVGAHAGAKAFAARRVNPQLRVYMFEPNPLNVELLRATFAGATGIDIVQAGVGNAPGRQKLYFDPDHLDTASLNPQHYFLQRNKRIDLVESDVEIVRLDDFFATIGDFRRAFLKIDVASMEAAVLEGAGETLARSAWLELEITQGESQAASDILATLMRHMRFDLLDCEFIGTGGTPKAVNLLFRRRDPA